MSALTVYDMQGAVVGETAFPGGMPTLKKGKQALHDVVVAEQAARRAGTASTLSKGRVAGSGAKPWRQKGTGRARAGYRQSPVWRGGGVAFGPHPRDFGVKVNRKTARLAFQRAFSEKLAAGSVKVVDAIRLDEPRTRHWTALMKALDVSTPVLFMLGTIDENIRLASRNAAGVEVVRAESVSVYQVLRYPTLITDRDGLAAIGKRFETWRRASRRADGSDKAAVGEAVASEAVAEEGES